MQSNDVYLFKSYGVVDVVCNIKCRIDKIESDMRYLHYLQISNKADGCRPTCRPDKRPRVDNVSYAKPPPAKQKPLTNYIRVSKPAFTSGAWGHTGTPLTKCRQDTDAHVGPLCDARCKAPCTLDTHRRPPPPYVEPPFVQTSRPQGPAFDSLCAKACRAPCLENSRRPAEIYKDPTMPSRRVPLVDNCTLRRQQGFEDVCVPECNNPCTEAARRGVPVVEDPPCLPTCTMGCSELMHCRPTSSERKRRHKTGTTRQSPLRNQSSRKLSESELQAADKKMRELEDRLKESNDKLREAEAQREASDEKVRTLEEQLRVAEKEVVLSEEQLRTLERSVSELESKLQVAERENDKLRASLEASRASSRRNSEAQSMALDLATKIADKYKAASAEKIDALNQIDNLKAEGDALLQRLMAAEQKATAFEQQRSSALEQQKASEECQEQLDSQRAEIERLTAALRDMEARGQTSGSPPGATSGSTDIEDLKREAANSMRRAAEAEARAEEATLRAKQLEEESRIADERANEAENEARDARQRAKDAEQRADDLEAASDDQRKRSQERTPGKKKCKCRSRSKKARAVEVPVQVKPVDYRNLRRHTCCLCCCKRNVLQHPREYPLAYRVDIR